ncbi:MAG: hypothetical protein QM786_14525 [Breznakibacter sp.]
MMNLMKFMLAGTVFFVIATFDNNAQSCRDYEKKCHSAPKEFKQSSLSRSFAIRKMKKIKLNTTFLGDREYHVAVCGRGKLGKIHIRLISDDAYRTVLYDNAADNFAVEKVFEIRETVKVFVEITAPHFFADNEFECAGINITYKDLK